MATARIFRVSSMMLTLTAAAMPAVAQTAPPVVASISPFKRKTTAETIASVLESQPDFSVLAEAAPAITVRLVRRCLEKDPARRLQHMGDVRILVEESMASTAGHPAGSHGSMSNRRTVWIATAGVAGALLPAIATNVSVILNWLAAVPVAK